VTDPWIDESMRAARSTLSAEKKDVAVANGSDRMSSIQQFDGRMSMYARERRLWRMDLNSAIQGGTFERAIRPWPWGKAVLIGARRTMGKQPAGEGAQSKQNDDRTVCWWERKSSLAVASFRIDGIQPSRYNSAYFCST
jgi:hypothetical protein